MTSRNVAKHIKTVAEEAIVRGPKIEQEQPIDFLSLSREEPVPGPSNDSAVTFLLISGLKVKMRDRPRIIPSFTMTFLQGHWADIPFTDPIVGVLAPMTTEEGMWLVDSTPWRSMSIFKEPNLLACMTSRYRYCPDYSGGLLGPMPMTCFKFGDGVCEFYHRIPNAKEYKRLVKQFNATNFNQLSKQYWDSVYAG